MEYSARDVKMNHNNENMSRMPVAYPGILFVGVQQIQLRTEDGGNGHLGAVAPYSGVLEAAVTWYKKFSFI